MGVMAYSVLGVEVNMLMLQQINSVLWQIIFAWPGLPTYHSRIFSV